MIRIVANLSAAIAAITVLSGGMQVVAPAFVLGVLDGETSPSSCHFFRIVGLFMMLFGGLLLHVWWGISDHRGGVPIYWCAWQKAGAVAAVIWGVMQGLFAPLALGVAGFDLISAVIIFLYARSLD